MTSNGRLAHAVGKAQDNPGVQHHLLRTIPPPDQPIQKATMIFPNTRWQACGLHATSYHESVPM
jgi:hypothetical protein